MSINDRHVRIDTRSQRSLKNSPDRFVIRGANTGNRIVHQALYSPVFMRAGALVTNTSDVSPGMTFPLKKDSIGVRGSALLAAGIKILRSWIVFISRRKDNRGFLETAQYCAFV